MCYGKPIIEVENGREVVGSLPLNQVDGDELFLLGIIDAILYCAMCVLRGWREAIK